MLISTFQNEMRKAGYTKEGVDVAWEDLFAVEKDIEAKTCKMPSEARNIAKVLISMKKEGKVLPPTLNITGDYYRAFDDAKNLDLPFEEAPNDERPASSVAMAE